MDLALLHSQKTMQLASQRNGQPWICTVYFVLHAGSFYWLSFPERRHSKELADHKRAAIAIAIKTETPVIGVQSEGNAALVKDPSEVEAVLEKYILKYNQGKEFIARFKAGVNRHMLYRFTPQYTVLFDELNHPNNPYRSIILR